MNPRIGCGTPYEPMLPPRHQEYSPQAPGIVPHFRSGVDHLSTPFFSSKTILNSDLPSLSVSFGWLSEFTGVPNRVRHT